MTLNYVFSLNLTCATNEHKLFIGKSSQNLSIQYILFEDLRQHHDAICKFGEDYSVMLKIAKTA